MALRLEPVSTMYRDRHSLMALTRAFFETLLRGYDPSRTYNMGDVLFIYDEPTDTFHFYAGKRNGITGLPFRLEDWVHLKNRPTGDVIFDILKNRLGNTSSDGNSGSGSGNAPQNPHVDTTDIFKQFFESSDDINKIREIFQTEENNQPSAPNENSTLMNIFHLINVAESETPAAAFQSTEDVPSEELGPMYGEVVDTRDNAVIAFFREPSTEKGDMIDF